MQAEAKIDEAEFFLDAVRESYNMMPDIIYYFNAFLGSAVSILEYLREDYANEFNFKIPIDDRNFKRKFSDKAQASSNKNIRTFHKWLIEKNIQIKNDDIGGLLINKRNRITHRRFELFSLRTRYRYKNIENSQPKIKELIVPWFDQQRTKSEKKKVEDISSNTIENKMVLLIDDDKTIDMEEACQIFLDKIKKIVMEAQKQFPISSK